MNPKPSNRKKKTVKANPERVLDRFEEKMWSLRPDAELKALMREAMAATGTSRQQLIFQCIRQELESVVGKIAEDRKAALSGFGKKPK